MQILRFRPRAGPPEGDLQLAEEAEKPILITRFNKDSEEWSGATYYNVRSGEPCSITTGKSGTDNVIPVRSYRSVVNAYVNNAESKFNGPDGHQGHPWTRGILQRMHVVAREHRYCGKEFKRKLEQGPLDHEADFTVEVYANGRVTANRETLGTLADFSEREINQATRLSRRIIRRIRHGGPVKPSTMKRITNFPSRTLKPAVKGVVQHPEGANRMLYKNPEHKRQSEQEHREQRNARRRMQRDEGVATTYPAKSNGRPATAE